MADEKTMAPEARDRRAFLRNSAVAATVVATASAAEAQQNAPGRLPSNTPITKLGVNPAEIAMLTPAAQKLTKADLMELREYQSKGDLKNAPLHLSIQDLNSITNAFHAMDVRQHSSQPGMLEGTTYSCCCCCSPCCSCCAAADIA
jgi:hypothetical protein